MDIKIHKTTGVVFKINSIEKRTVYMTVLENPNNYPGVKIGMKQKTTPICLDIQFTNKSK